MRLSAKPALMVGRLVLTLAALLILALPGQAQLPPLEVKVMAKESHGLFYLLQCLRGNPHQSHHLAELFWTLHPRSAADAQALEGFERLLDDPDWLSISLPGDGQKRRRLADVLEVLALQANDSEDFLERSQGVLNIQNSRDLAAAVHHFAPLYHQLIWAPSQAEFGKQMEELKAILKKNAAGEHLAQARRFYGSQWPVDRAFWVALVPIPRKPGEEFQTFGHSDSFLEVVEVVAGTPVASQAGVVFHELCHGLWGTRPAAAQDRLRDDFAQLGEAGRYAYDQLDEALATALGNGWFQSLVNGKPPIEPWYADEIIDQYARALYEMVHAAVQNGTASPALDRAFATKAVEQFIHRFPRYAEDINVVLRKIVMVSNLPLVHRGEFQQRLSSLRFARTIYGTRDLGGPATQEVLAAHPYASRLYLIRPEQRRTLQDLYGFPNLPERGLITLRKNEAWHLVAVATSSEEYVSLLADLTKKRYLQAALFGPSP